MQKIELLFLFTCHIFFVFIYAPPTLYKEIAVIMYLMLLHQNFNETIFYMHKKTHTIITYFLFCPPNWDHISTTTPGQLYSYIENCIQKKKKKMYIWAQQKGKIQQRILQLNWKMKNRVAQVYMINQKFLVLFLFCLFTFCCFHLIFLSCFFSWKG